MRGVLGLIGLAGTVLLLFGLLSSAFTLEFDLWSAVHVAGGGVLILLSVLLNFAGFRRTVTARSTRERAGAMAGTIIFIAVLIGVNILVARKPLRWDLTESRLHTLSEKTVRLLESIDEPVRLLAFFQEGDDGLADLERLLERYGAEAPSLTWEVIDPEQRPDVAMRHDVRRKGVLVALRGDSEAVSSGDPAFGHTESTLNNLLLRVSRAETPKLYVLSGHGEPALADARTSVGLSALAETLREEGFRVEELLLATRADVPADADGVLVVGPRKAMTGAEVDALRDYSAAGGRLLLGLEPTVQSGLEGWLAELGLVPNDDVIVDETRSIFGSAAVGIQPVIEDFADHPVTRGFDERIVLPTARSISVEPPADTPDAARPRIIARSSLQSWAERDYADMLARGTVRRDDGDRRGPLGVVAALAIPPEAADGEGPAGAESRLVVVGDADFLGNAYLDRMFNREFALAVLQWLSGNERFIAEPPRGFRPSRLEISGGEYRTLFRLGVLLLPESLLIIGLAVWWWRRSL